MSGIAADEAFTSNVQASVIFATFSSNQTCFKDVSRQEMRFCGYSTGQARTLDRPQRDLIQPILFSSFLKNRLTPLSSLPAWCSALPVG